MYANTLYLSARPSLLKKTFVTILLTPETMELTFTRKNLLFSLIAICFLILSAPTSSYGFGNSYYIPNAASFSGTNTYCQNQTPTNICANYTTCSSGSGPVAAVNGTVQWYYMTPAQFTAWTTAGSNCNNAPAFGTAYGPGDVFNNTATTGSRCTLPNTALAPGTYRYFASYTLSATTAGACSGNTVWCSYAVTINAPTSSPIGGTTTLCAGGATTTLTHPAAGGTWSSSNVGVASIGSGTGLVTTGTAGTTTIVYQGGTCAATASVVLTVNPLPNNLTGVSLCSGGSAITMSNSATGGTWTSSNPAVASIGVNSGVLTPGVVGAGLSGTTTISYNTACGTRTAVITVNGTPGTITGTNPICPGGATTTLSAAANGTWTSSTPAVASINSASGLVTSGPSGGTTTITYSNGCGSSAMTFSVTAPIAAITGNTVICTGGATTTLSNTTLGGSWTSSVPAVASVVTTGAGGVVTSGVIGTGLSGNTVITYSTGCGAPATATVTVLGPPGAIIGTPSVCQGFTTTLSAGVMGTWSSANSAIAAATGTGAGTITGVSGGSSNANTVITYSNGCAPASVITVTVTAAPTPISGGPNVCDNGSITLSSGVSGGTWLSTNPSSATVTLGPVGGGVVFGVAGQGGTNTGILYSNGCGIQTTTITVQGVPTLITGPTFVCAGANITLSNNGIPTGTWTSSNPAAVSINTTTGVITGGVNGTSVITAANACGSVTYTVTASTPSAITGNLTFCQNGTTTLSNGVAGGVWSSGNPLLGTTTGVVNDGTVYGVPLGGTGCFNITYTLPSGCFTHTVLCTTVAPGPINGIFAVCHNGTTNLTDATPGGTWSSSNSSIAGINNTGLVTGNNPGTAVITYSIGTCPSTATITVDPLPTAIVGPGVVCEGATIALTDLTPGGGWSVSNTNASIDPAGVLSAYHAGSSTVTYTMPSGCYVTRNITINAIPSPITGPNSVCVGSSIALSDPTPAGTWGSSNVTIAPVTSAGVVTGGNPGGVANITYTLNATGCFVTKPITVNTLPGPVVGPTALCTGICSAVTAAPSGGTWSSSNNAIATIDVVTGTLCAVSSGTTTIVYTNSSTTCTASLTLTVNQMPSLISGMDSVCVGLTTNLSNTVSGGAWTSVNTAVATVHPTTGVVTGVFGYGTSEIIYSRLGCAVSRTVTVNPNPAPITGPMAICVGATGLFSSGPAGGTWSSSNNVIAPINSASGIVTGTAPGGVTNIIYTLPTTCIATLSSVTVNPLPANISGPSALCAGQTAQLSSNPGTGVWSTSNSTIATVTPTGFLTAGANPGGVVVIGYTLPTGCSAQLTLTVNPIPSPILGASSVCAGNSVTLSDVTPAGVWTSSNVTVASVTPGPGAGGGVVTGGNVVGTSQTTVLTYSLSTGCTATKTFTVNPLPTAITGNTTICAGLTTQLSNGSPFGVWSSSNPGVAAVNSFTGLVTGGPVLTQQTAVITYSLSTGCTALITVTVNPLPSAIIGNLRICSGNTSLLSNSSGAGTWTSSNSSVATVDISTGLVTGGAVPLPGPLTSRITFTLSSTGCIAVSTMTVSALPLPIMGPSSVCQGSCVSMSSATGGGVWSSSNSSLATVSLTGPTVFVCATSTGGPTGIDTIMYTISSGCMQTKTVEVTLQPDPITGGPLSLCQGSSGSLSDATPGGVWSTSNSAVATVVGGVVTAGTVIGTANISYTLGSCTSIVIVNVKVQPGPITGVKTMCYGSGTTLSNATPLGIWTSSDPTRAVINGAGIVTSGLPGMDTGTSVITYNVAGCTAMTTVTVTPQPTAITGINTFCNLTSVTLSNSVTGGVWSTQNSNVAVVDVNGVVTGTVAMPMSSNATTLISYTMPGTGCFAVRSVTVKIQPMPIIGNTTICLNSTTQLSSFPGTGTWSANTTSQAYISVGATGIVTGVGASAGTGDVPVVEYTINGCTASASMTVNPLPSQITGTFFLCLGSCTTLADLTPSGVWSSSTPSVATVLPAAGVVCGASLGTTRISYTLPTGCYVTQTVQVIPVPGAITGGSSVCQGTTIPLSSATFGGTWTTSNTSIATIDPTSGVLSGVDAGTVVTSYTLGTGCRVIAPIVVYPLQPITGGTTVCSGQTLALSDATVGGTWTTSNSAVATITPGGLLTGGTPGTAVIGWNLPSGCVATTTITVQALPGVITGNATICDFQTTTFSNSVAGGVWSSSNPTVAAINPLTGDVLTGSGITTTTNVIISYTLGCSQTTTLVVNPVPQPIVGNTNMCLGYTQLFSSPTPFGVWSTSNSSVVGIDPVTGLATGNNTGTETIMYTLPTGCSASAIVVVNPLPSAITGSSNVCLNSTVSLSSASGGGAWTSSNPTIAGVDFATGVVTGNGIGTAVITYMVATGCITTFTITVDPLPDPITGPSLVCVGSSITLNTTTPGVSWSSSNTIVATVSGTGVVTGMAVGTADIIATITSTGCNTTHSISVNPLPAPITGNFKICRGMTSLLASASPGGVWTSSNTFVGTVDPSSGLVTSDANPPVSVFNIIYTLPTGCATLQTMTVVNAPSPIYGVGQVCVGSCTPLSDTTAGGVWSSFDVTVATVDPVTGVVCGVNAGFSIITYTMGGGSCYETHVIIVNPLPAPITGNTEVCAGLTTQLSDATPGGVWSSQNPIIASVVPVGPSAGLVTGGGTPGGLTTITYTLPTSCYVTTTFVTHPLPAPITGNTNICVGNSVVLSSSPQPGTWSSSNTMVASVINSTAGVIYGVDYNVPVGAPYAVANITYTIAATGCIRTTTVAVHPLPQIFTVTGGGSYCSGTGGVLVGLSGSQIGVNYYLYLGSSTPTGPFAGTGLPLSFGMQTAGGVYTVVANNTYTTCSSNMTGSATITVIPSVTPTVDISPSPDDTVCSGTAVTFIPIATNEGTSPVYNWSVNGLLMSIGASYTFVPANGDVVSVVLNSNAICAIPNVARDTMAMTVYTSATPAVNILFSPNDTVCRGTAVTLTAVPFNGGAAPTYQWTVNGLPVATTPAYTYTPSDGDLVYVTMNSNAPCRLTTTVQSPTEIMEVVNPVIPTVIITASNGSLITAGQSDTLTANVTNGVSPTFQWYLNGVPVTGATGPTFVIDNAHYGDSIGVMVYNHGFCEEKGFSWMYIQVHSVGVNNVVGVSSDIVVVPNPNNGVFTVKGTLGSTIDEDVNLELTNMLGQSVYKTDVKAKNGKLNATIQLNGSVANGMYMLNVRTGNEHKVFHVVVEQ